MMFQFQLVARLWMAYLAKKLTESLVYMARKHVHVIEKRSLYSQNVFCYFFLLLWCVPYHGEFSVLYSIGRGNLENSGKQ